MHNTLQKNILGLPISVMDKATVALTIRNAIRTKTPIKLAFVNANLANIAVADYEFHTKLQSFLLLNDGSGLNLASRLLYGNIFPDNLNGTDFIPYFLDSCDFKLRIFLLGATPSISQATVKAFGLTWPQHEVVGAHHGYFQKEDELFVFAKVQELQPDIVFVAMGNGKQEIWVDNLVPSATLTSWGVGAFFDFLCNEVPRAPLWMRKSGIEWIYRLVLEPKRLWRRYLIGNFQFVYYVIKSKALSSRLYNYFK